MTTLRWVRRRVGRRGVFLILFGVVYLLLGYSYLGVTVTPVVRQALRLALNVAPLQVYAWAWVTAGAICVVSGLVSPARKPIGFTTAVLMPTLWAVVYMAAWVDGDIPRGWVTAVLFAAIAAAVAVVAGMPEPAALRVRQ